MRDFGNFIGSIPVIGLLIVGAYEQNFPMAHLAIGILIWFELFNIHETLKKLVP